ncbi:HD domain-containing protein [Aquibacillus halophilus]|uniref:HD domain-containing protein n=1 Tax=Aquibacillus halophilus TaxID=930132 RepID=A0A6A8DFA9_9BACI|nr:HD domain-containing protein [Aquibacillus halophilus]MRH42461.1 HD domain-containing protein [Aquibacillus halophilus]
MDNQTKMTQIEEYVFNLFKDDETGHDYFHMKRVASMAKKIAKMESADAFIAESAAWLHDIGDKKLFNKPEDAIDDMYLFLRNINFSGSEIKQIDNIIRYISFSAGHKKPLTIEGQIVQDADRLDAIGAIGIARTFAYGASNQQLIYSDDSDSTSIQHFHDKLLLLKDLMNTNTGKLIAKERHQFMESFLKQFYSEWNLIHKK